MQQAATAQQVPSGATDGDAAPGVLRNGFVINLTSSTTPVALKRPEHAGLKRFTFFVSRRREEGRERFRLHMGYFDSQEEAEKLLDIVREIYPGAWAGLAPGRGLRGTPPVAQPEDAAPAVVSEEAAEAPVVTRSGSTTRIDGARPVAAVAAVHVPPTAEERASARTDTDSPATERRVRLATERQEAPQSPGNVRGTIDALEDSAGAAAAAAMLPRKPRVVPTLRPAAAIPTLRPIAPPTPVTRAAAAAKPPSHSSATTAAVPAARSDQPSRPAQQPARALSERAVLQLLESSKRAARKAPAAAPPSERPCFAVQLAWSAEPIDLTRVPQLAIFNAYTLYGAQGHRDGNRWYGVRLGFFTDAVSAKQVAQYVRSDFATVSVVPVSTRERDSAKRAIAVASAPSPTTVVPVVGAARPARPVPVAANVSLDEFKFIDDAAAESVPKQSREARGEVKAERSLRPSRGAPGKRAVFRAGRIHARSKAKPMTLEQTLEILGANDLEVDGRKKRVANGDDIPAPAAPAHAKPSKLSRLFERLSERLGT